MSLGKKTFRDISLTFSQQVVRIVCHLLFWIVLARVLGPRGTGEFAVAILVPMLLVTFLNLGIPSANVYLMGRGEILPGESLRKTMWVWVIMSLVGMVGMGSIIAGFAEVAFPETPKTLLWIATAIFPIALLQNLLASLLQAQESFRRYNLVQILPPSASLVAAVGLVLWLDLGVTGAVACWGLGQFMSLAVCAWFLLTAFRSPATARGSSNLTRRWLGYGWKSHVAGLLVFLSYRADIFLVNLFLGPLAVGIYTVAVQIAERLWLMSFASSTVLLPRLSRLHGDEAARRRLTPLTARWVTYTALFGAIALAVLAGPLVRMLFGAEYIGAARVLVWLLPGIVVLSSARILANDLTARGRPDLNIWIGMTAFLVNIAGNLLLIPRYGLVGAAAATTISYGAATVACFVLYARLSLTDWWRPLVLERDDWRRLRQILAVRPLPAGKSH